MPISTFQVARGAAAVGQTEDRLRETAPLGLVGDSRATGAGTLIVGLGVRQAGRVLN